MSSGETAYLYMTIGAFVVFALALAWVSFTEKKS